MKQFKHFAVVAAFLALGLAGCQKETPTDDGDLSSDGGKAARMSLSFTVPTAINSRAVQDGTDQDAVAGESTINTVDVYIFRSTGLAATEGAHTRLTLADFTEDGARPGTYVLNADKLIETHSGEDTKIHVGANLSEDFDKEFADEAALLAETADVDTAPVWGGEGAMFYSNSFWMFSDAVTTVDLVAYDETDPTTVNNATVKLERVVAKVAVAAVGAAIVDGAYTVTWPGDDLEMTYTFAHFRPYQDARKSYVAPNFLTAADAVNFPDYIGKHKTYTPWDGSLYSVADNNARYSSAIPGPDLMRSVYTSTGDVVSADAVTADNWYYVGENRDYATPSAAGKSTYVMVGTTVSVNKAAEWDDDTDAVIYADASYGGNSSDVFIVNAGGHAYVTDTEVKANAILAGVNEAAGEEICAIYKYTGGWVHFPVYLDGYAGTHVENRYGVFRNQFLLVNIAGVIGEPGFFPGYPGDPTNPLNPIDPNPTEPDPTNPWPEDPNEPVDGLPAMLEVEFSVAPWYYLLKDGVILQ